MKRVGHLYEQIYDWDNLLVAYESARSGKTKYRQVREFEPVAEQKLKELQRMLIDMTFVNGEYHIFELQERGKLRTIYALPFFPDRILHHAILQVVGPIWLRSLVRDTYASIPGRGIHDAVKRVQRAVKSRDDLYCLKLDIRQFYPSVDHDCLKAVIRRTIKDWKLLWLLDVVIQSAPGIPIGNYLSQYFGNLFLSPMDHYITEELRPEFYFRYCDDFVLLDASKQKLRSARAKIAKFLCEYRLTLKSSWQVFPLSDRGLDFVGYRFWPTHTLIRRKNIQRLKWRLKVKRMGLCEAVRLTNAIGSFQGWLRYGDTANLKRRLLLPVTGRTRRYFRSLREELLNDSG